MRELSFGVSLPLGPEVSAAAAQAEQLGFDYVSCGEHLAFHEPTANTFVTLAAAAGATTRIGLCSAITLAPLYPPVLLAKLVAAIDDVSGGRFTLGVGVGGENPVEFGAVGVSPRERGVRTNEALGVLAELLAGDSDAFERRFPALTGFEIAPRPATGRVPVWIAGRGIASTQRAAKYGDGWVPYLYSPERLQAGLVSLREEASRVGRPWQGRAVVHLFTNVGGDARAARRTSVEMVSRTYRQDFEPLADKYLLHGNAHDCVRRLREYRDAGADTFLFRLAAEAPDMPAMVRLLSDEVVAPLRGEG